MSFEVRTIEPFDRKVKRLLRKYPSLQADLRRLGELLAVVPTSGTPIGAGCYKVRLAISSKGKGKSGGARLISYVVVRNKRVWLLTIYDKSELDSVPLSEVKALLKFIPA